MLVKKESNSNYLTAFDPVSKGDHLARCIGVVDMGLEKSMFSDTFQPKTLFVFEVQDEPVEWEGELVPKIITAKVTTSAYEKSTMRQWLNNWLAPDDSEFDTGFDLERCVNEPCMIHVNHDISKKDKSKIFDKVTNVSSVYKGLVVKAATNSLFYFSYPEHDVQRLIIARKYDIIEDTVRAVDNLPTIFKIQERVKNGLTYQSYFKAMP